MKLLEYQKFLKLHEVSIRKLAKAKIADLPFIISEVFGISALVRSRLGGTASAETLLARQANAIAAIMQIVYLPLVAMITCKCPYNFTQMVYYCSICLVLEPFCTLTNKEMPSGSS